MNVVHEKAFYRRHRFIGGSWAQTGALTQDSLRWNKVLVNGVPTMDPGAVEIVNSFLEGYYGHPYLVGLARISVCMFQFVFYDTLPIFTRVSPLAAPTLPLSPTL